MMGTPAFAVPILETLANTQEVVGVVTRPDQPAGRGRRVTVSPVKQAALRLGLPVYQPSSLRVPEVVAQLAGWQPEVVVVAAYGLIVPPDILGIPPAGCLNVHASLLPRWRGAAPVAAAILAGDTQTGVTIIKMDEGVDTGPILAQRGEPIRPDDTQQTLSARLAQLGAALLAEVLPVYLRGELVPSAQPDEGVTYAPPLRKADGWLDWSRPAVELERQVRACDPWPGTFTVWKGKLLRVLRVSVAPNWRCSGRPGTVVAWDNSVGVITGEGVLRLEVLQLAGKRPMDIHAFVRGQRDFVNSQLGAS